MPMLFRESSPGPAYNQKNNSYLGKFLKSRVYLLVLLLLSLFLITRNSGLKHERAHPHGLREEGEEEVDFSALYMPDQALENKQSGMPIPWGVSYSPYTETGLCRSLNRITEDLEKIHQSGIGSVRFYSLDCRVLEASEQVPGLKIILGLQPSAPIGTSSADYLQQLIESLEIQIQDISRWGHWDCLSMVVVGSQGVFEETYSRAELVKLLRYVRKSINSRGFKGLITTAEPVQSWISATRYNAASFQEYEQYQQYQRILSLEDEVDFSDSIEDNDLCEVVDVIGLVIEPYFNKAGEAESAGQNLIRDVQHASRLCSDAFIGSAHSEYTIHSDSDHNESINGMSKRPVVVLEAGWPSHGEDNGYALASENEQRIAIEEMVNARHEPTGSRIPVVLYSYEDEVWRDPGSLKVETAFGVQRFYD